MSNLKMLSLKKYMKEFFDYLSSLGINDPPDAFAVLHKKDFKQVFKVFENILIYISKDKKFNLSPTTPFSFSANSSLSGGDFPCQMLPCRINRVSNLVNFAGLYADTLIISDPFKRYKENYPFSNKEKFYNDFINDLTILMVYKPLIEEGIVKINNYHICSDCLCNYLHDNRGIDIKKRLEQIANKVKKIVTPKINLKLGTQKVLILKDENGLTDINVIKFKKLPRDFNKIADKVPYIFSQREIKNLKGLWGTIFDRSLDDLLYQKYSPFTAKYSYLTNRKIDTLLIQEFGAQGDFFNGNNLVDNFTESLEHPLPFLINADIKQVLEIRRRESESFNSYREAVAKVLRYKKNKLSPEDEKEILGETISPEIKKIDKIVKQHKKYGRSRLAKKAIFTLASIGIGVFGKEYLNLDIQNINSIVGVFNCGSFFEEWLKLKENPITAVDNDYYFLWKLNKKFNNC